jgi:hypothetical protein
VKGSLRRDTRQLSENNNSWLKLNININNKLRKRREKRQKEKKKKNKLLSRLPLKLLRIVPLQDCFKPQMMLHHLLI